MRDIDESILSDAMANVESALDGGVERGKLDESEKAAALDRLSTTTDLAEAVADADIVVEAVPEEMDLKRETFARTEDHAPADAVIATNTSSLSVTAVASALEDPSRAVGTHFFNPPYVMDLVEVVVAETTGEATVEFAEGFAENLGKEPIVVRDSAGFATSRLGVALGVEALRMLEEGVAGPREIDRSMELGYNHPMGPVELTDVVGLDVRLDVLEYLREELGERFRPPQILRRKVRAGKLGKKTGEGFYVWEDGEPVAPAGEYAATPGGAAGGSEATADGATAAENGGDDR